MNTDQEETDSLPFYMSARVVLKEDSPYGKEETLIALRDVIIDETFGTYMDSYEDERGNLVINFEVPRIIGKFYGAASRSFEEAVIGNETKVNLGIDNFVIYENVNIEAKS